VEYKIKEIDNGAQTLSRQDEDVGAMTVSFFEVKL